MPQLECKTKGSNNFAPSLKGNVGFIEVLSNLIKGNLTFDAFDLSKKHFQFSLK